MSNENNTERDADFSALNKENLSGDEQQQPPEEEGKLSRGEKKRIKQLEKEVHELKDSLAEQKNKYLRALADMENLKKRSARERSDLLKYQGEHIFSDLLPVVDNFELALAHSSGKGEDLAEGVRLIHKMFSDVLAKWEVKAESKEGQAFDPHTHSAISQVPTADADPGTVLQELKKAYFYKDKLIREGEAVVAAAIEGVSDNSKVEEAEPEEAEPSAVDENQTSNEGVTED